MCSSDLVGVAGLGIGYYVQRILDTEDVAEVIVYEINQNVIDVYLKNFGHHEKVTIKNEDVRTITGEYFDFFYNDIYKNVLDENVIKDMALIINNNEIDRYHSGLRSRRSMKCTRPVDYFTLTATPTCLFGNHLYALRASPLGCALPIGQYA